MKPRQSMKKRSTLDTSNGDPLAWETGEGPEGPEASAPSMVQAIAAMLLEPSRFIGGASSDGQHDREEFDALREQVKKIAEKLHGLERHPESNSARAIDGRKAYAAMMASEDPPVLLASALQAAAPFSGRISVAAVMEARRKMRATPSVHEPRHIADARGERAKRGALQGYRRALRLDRDGLSPDALRSAMRRVEGLNDEHRRGDLVLPTPARSIIPSTIAMLIERAKPRDTIQVDAVMRALVNGLTGEAMIDSDDDRSALADVLVGHLARLRRRAARARRDKSEPSVNDAVEIACAAVALGIVVLPLARYPWAHGLPAIVGDRRRPYRRFAERCRRSAERSLRRSKPGVWRAMVGLDLPRLDSD